MSGGQWFKQHLSQLRVSFDEADKDESGSVSLDELLKVLQDNGFKGSKDDAKDLFSKLDVNQDQKLSREEFCSAINNLPRITVKEYVLRKAFKSLDKDDSGTLTRAEIEQANSEEGGVAIAPEKIQELLKTLGKDSKDDVVDYEEFLHALGMEDTATVMYQVFGELDSDKSGFLTREEIMKTLDTDSELKLRAAKISDLLIAWHKDKDQKLNYKEFVQVWIKHK